MHACAEPKRRRRPPQPRSPSACSPAAVAQASRTSASKIRACNGPRREDARRGMSESREPTASPMGMASVGMAHRPLDGTRHPCIFRLFSRSRPSPGRQLTLRRHALHRDAAPGSGLRPGELRLGGPALLPASAQLPEGGGCHHGQPALRQAGAGAGRDLGPGGRSPASRMRSCHCMLGHTQRAAAAWAASCCLALVVVPRAEGLQRETQKFSRG